MQKGGRLVELDLRLLRTGNRKDQRAQGMIGVMVLLGIGTARAEADRYNNEAGGESRSVKTTCPSHGRTHGFQRHIKSVY